jgi:ribokinase
MSVDRAGVLVLGSVNLDLVLRSQRLPAVGETVAGAQISESLGGKGANQAIAAARMEADVTLVACVGEDAAGDGALQTLRAEGIETRHCRRVADPTGRAAVLVDEHGENLISVGAGANSRVGADDLATVTWPEVLLAQLEIPPATVAAGLRQAHERGVTSVLNATPATALGEVGEVPDMLIVNRVEAGQVLGSDGSDASAAQLAVAVAGALGIATVVVTDGAHGAAAAVDGGSGQTVTASSPQVQVVDSTGAGDAFAGVFAAALAEDMPLAQALRRGCAAGALACTIVGAVPSLPRRRAVLAAVGR